MNLEQLLTEYEAGPSLLRHSVARVSEDQCRQHPVPNTWSILEVICHLADYETIYSDRMKRVLAEENPTLPAALPADYCNALHYQHRNLQDELAVIDAVRRQTAQLLRCLDIEAFQRTGVHTEDGPLTLETLLERIVEHIPHHVRFIEQKANCLLRSEE